jgi:hypothetical protein
MAFINFQPHDIFNTLLYTGNSSSSNALTGVGFQPDWTWIKARNYGDSHRLYDSVRGAGYHISSNGTNGSDNSFPLSSFDSDGFTIGSSDPSINSSSYNYLAHNWKAGTTSGISGGTITPSGYSFNSSGKFSVIQWTGTGATGTVPHGLGVKPDLIIIKRVDQNGNNWQVYHSYRGAGKKSFLNSTSAEASSGWMNSTEPDTSVFTVIDDADINSSGGTYIAYCFAQVKGFSRMGFYKGTNNTDDSFIYCGFKPALVVIKNYEQNQSWYMYNNKTKGFNTENDYIQPDTSSTENSDTDQIDIISNGFKLMSTDSGTNGNNYDHIFWAFAAQPLVSSNGDPANAQ